MTPSTHANRFARLESSDIIRAAAIVELLAGIWLYLSPWIYWVTSGTAFNGWVLGSLIAVTAAFQLGCPGETAELTGLVNSFLGVWVFVSPWILGYSADTGRFVNSLCVGATVFIAAVTTFVAARWKPNHPSYCDHLAARCVPMLNKHAERNIVFECLVAMCMVTAATTALIAWLIVDDLEPRFQRALGVTYTWTWTNASELAQKAVPPQAAWFGAGRPRVGWLACLILMGAAAVLIGGIVFSLLKTQRPVLSASARRLARQYEVFQTDLARIEREMLRDQSITIEEPYPHHETHPESPGQDQGQLTSHLSGSTPFFEGLDSTIHGSMKFRELFLRKT
jgi:hypothetical protein